MKKLDKYKIAPQAKFVKFKVKYFVEIPTIRHDKVVSPLAWLPKIIFLPLNVSPPWLLKFSSCPPWLVDDTKIPPPPDPRGGGHYKYVEFFWKVLKAILPKCYFSSLGNCLIFFTRSSCDLDCILTMISWQKLGKCYWFISYSKYTTGIKIAVRHRTLSNKKCYMSSTHASKRAFCLALYHMWKIP